MQGKRIIIQGFGNVGYWAAKFFQEEGAIITGIAEVDGSIHNPNGICPDSLLKFKKELNRINGFPNEGGKHWFNESAIYEEWYYSFNSVISSFQLLLSNPSMSRMRISLNANSSWKLLMGRPPGKQNKFYWGGEFNSCLMCYAMPEV